MAKKILKFSIKRLRELNREIYVVTSEKIEAYNFYRKHGFKKFRRYKDFVIMRKAYKFLHGPLLL